MKIALYEIIIIITIFQLLIFTCFLFTKKPFKKSNIILGIFLFAESLGFFDNLCFSQFDFFYQNYPDLFLIGIPFAFIWGPSVYIFVKSFVTNNFKFRKIFLLHLTPFIICLLWLTLIYYQYDVNTKKILLISPSFVLNKYQKIINYTVLVQILVYNILSLFILKSFRKSLKDSYSSISKINLSWLSFVIIGFLISYLVSASNQVAWFTFGINSSILNIGVYLTFFVFFNIIFFKAWKQPELFSVIEESIKYRSSKLTKEEADIWIKKLNNYIVTNKPYLDPELTINQLAENLDIPPRILSQILNEYLNQSFYDYINTLRIEESKKMLLDSSDKKTILEILFEAGFNSKQSFNIAFKKSTGITPTEFKKKAKDFSGITS